MSFALRRLAESSARKVAAFPAGTPAKVYSKKPFPAPLALRPSSTFHCFWLHAAWVKAAGGTETTFAAASPRVTKQAKLRATVSAPSLRTKQTVPHAVVRGSATGTSKRRPFCHEAAVKAPASCHSPSTGFPAASQARTR